MKPPRPASNRLVAPVGFVTALTAVWLVRWGLSGSAPPDGLTQKSSGRSPASSFIQRHHGQADAPLPRPDGLFSVAAGWVVWPPENTGRSGITAAFAAAWRSMAPESDHSGLILRNVDEAKALQLFADWWKADPAGVQRFVSEPPGHFFANGGSFLLPHLTAKDPAQALELAMAAAEPGSKSRARAEVLAVWAEKSPESVLTYVSGLPASARLEVEKTTLLALPVDKALAWCARQPSSWQRRQLEQSLLSGLLKEDPAQAASLLRSGRLGSDSLKKLFPETSEGPPPESALRMARAAVAADPDPAGFARWAAGQPSAALGMAALMALWEKHPEMAAATLADAHGPAQDQLAAAAAYTVPSLALDWAARNSRTLDIFFKAWAEHDPASALAAADSLPSAAAAARLAIATRIAESDPAQAIATLSGHPDPRAASPVLLRAARQIASKDPGLALRTLAQAESTSPVEVSAILALGGRVDPPGTAAALGSLDLPVSDFVAVESFTRGWATASPEAASQWVTGLPPGELRDGGAAGLARQVGAEDPVGGFLWALEIRDAPLRGRVLDSLQRTRPQEPAALETLLQDPRLQPAQQATLRTRLQPVPARQP